MREFARPGSLLDLEGGVFEQRICLYPVSHEVGEFPLILGALGGEQNEFHEAVLAGLRAIHSWALVGFDCLHDTPREPFNAERVPGPQASHGEFWDL